MLGNVARRTDSGGSLRQTGSGCRQDGLLLRQLSLGVLCRRVRVGLRAFSLVVAMSLAW